LAGVGGVTIRITRRAERDLDIKDLRIQPNGCVPRTTYLWQVKEPAQSKQKYDLFTQLAAMPTPEAFPPPALFGCPLVPS
jgi:branched-chain amino acid transport system substrate-binding protein